MNEQEHDDALWTWGRTKAEARDQVLAASQRQQQERNATTLASWRARNPEATCSDFVALTLADLEGLYATTRPLRSRDEATAHRGEPT